MQGLSLTALRFKMGSERPAISDRAPLARVGKAHRKTAAAKWNREVLRRLGDMLEKDPEADLASLLSSASKLMQTPCSAPIPVNKEDLNYKAFVR